jgi:hypothetical protein
MPDIGTGCRRFGKVFREERVTCKVETCLFEPDKNGCEDRSCVCGIGRLEQKKHVLFARSLEKGATGVVGINCDHGFLVGAEEICA